MGDAVRYDADFYAWTQDQARVLREAAAARANLPLDFENLAEEVADLGSNRKNAVNSALERILEHLLKLEYSPARYPRGDWMASVDVHRAHLRRDLAESGSLRGHLDLPGAYRLARRVASRGLARDGLTIADLPEHCPYTLTEAEDEDWFPANRHGIED